MGIKITYRFLFWLVFFPLSGFCQAKKNSLLFSEAKGYVLCECIRRGYTAADSSLSTKLKDYSGAYFVQISALSLSAQKKISLYVTENIGKYEGVPAEKSASNPTANMVTYSCWKLYESKKVSNYIKKLMRSADW